MTWQLTAWESKPMQNEKMNGTYSSAFVQLESRDLDIATVHYYYILAGIFKQGHVP